MKQENIYKIAPTFISVFVFCFAIVFYALGWTEPAVAPPGGNVDVPINVGGTGQSKAGGLVLNTGGAANGLIVQNGKVGIGTASPSQKLDVVGQIHATQDICTDAGGGKCLGTIGSGGASGLTFGTYTGNGAATQSVSVGFQPQFVMVIPNTGDANNDIWVKASSMGLYARNVTEGDGSVPASEVWALNVIVSFNANGFVVGSGSSNDLNESGVVYTYMASM